jgi:hypothetical protein
MSYNEYDAADEIDDLSALGGTEGKPPISLEQTEFSLNHFAKQLGQPNLSAFNKWNEVWVAGFGDKKHWPMFRKRNRLK